MVLVDETTKLVKVSGDTDLLSEWVAEGVAFDPQDFTARSG